MPKVSTHANGEEVHQRLYPQSREAKGVLTFALGVQASKEEVPKRYPQPMEAKGVLTLKLGVQPS